ncbi:MAG: diguanylate cyclase [Desulfovibrio sp.]|nr:diguanylate cyclase [Desulfovibrio sp.]
MTDILLIDIIDSCLAMDRQASEVYSQFSITFKDPDLAAFWRSMADEEREHVLFWEALKAFALDGHLPQVFENPEKMLQGLAHGRAEVERLVFLCQGCDDVNRAFVLCYRLESALMHPAFETLFRFADDSNLPMPMTSPDTQYEDHIQHFVDGLKRFGRLTPEMELIGELLARIWEETRLFVVQVHTDPLTGILNRRGFFRVIEPLVFLNVRNVQPAGLLMIDVDRFKDVNDLHGHQTGDKVLASVAGSLRRVLRRSDVVGRYGGEEFIVYLPGCERAYMNVVAEKVRDAVEKTLHHGIGVTVSVGAAYLERVRSSGEMERLITMADKCLYSAKREGRNRVFLECSNPSD